MVKSVTYFLLFFSMWASGQTYVLPNEEVLFSFETKKGKKLMICQDRNEEYLVYRYGNKDKIELEFPTQKDSTSYQKFEYSYWLRGGGKQNAGLDLNYLSFTIESLKYVVYDLYYAEDNSKLIGIRVINTQTDQSTTIVGQPKTTNGALMLFRDIDRIPKIDTIYD